jgi:hypothetical protein
LTKPERLTLMALAHHADKDGRAWPSLDTICTMMDLGRTSVFSALRVLKARGIIEKDWTPGVRGSVCFPAPGSRDTASGVRGPGNERSVHGANATSPPHELAYKEDEQVIEQEDPPSPQRGNGAAQQPLALESPASQEHEQPRNRGASKASATRLATELLAELNAARKRVNPKNRELAPVEANLVEIRARLLEGVTADDIRHVIAVQEGRSRVSADDAKWFNATTPFRKGNIGMWLAKTVEDSGRPERQAGPSWQPPDPVAPPYFDRYVPKPRRESEPPPPGTLDVLKNLRPAP